MLIPLEVDRAALLLVDVQRDYLHAGGAFAKHGLRGMSDEQALAIVRSCQRLADAMRKRCRPVVFANTGVRADRSDWALPDEYRRLPEEFLVEGSWGAQVMDGLAVEFGAVVLIKKGWSAFLHTHLDRMLGNLGIQHLVVAGGTATGGLADTVRTGAPLGYELFIAEDAVFPPDSTFLQRLEVRAEFTTAAEVEAIATGAHDVRAQDSKIAGRTALLLVDMQNDFLHAKGVMRRLGYSPLTDESTARVIANNRKLVEVMHSRGLPVIFARVGQRADGLDRATDDVVTKRRRPLLMETDFMTRGTWGSQLADELEPQEQDIVVEKEGHSSFGFTPLHRILRNLGVRRCLVTGGATTGCVSDTVREGIGLGYEMTVISDATYPPDSPYLEALSSFTKVCSTEAALPELGQS